MAGMDANMCAMSGMNPSRAALLWAASDVWYLRGQEAVMTHGAMGESTLAQGRGGWGWRAHRDETLWWRGVRGQTSNRSQACVFTSSEDVMGVAGVRIHQARQHHQERHLAPVTYVLVQVMTDVVAVTGVTDLLAS